MSQKSFYNVSGTIFLLVAIGHFLRVLNSWEVTIDTFRVPMWFSWFVVLLLGYLALQGLGKKR